MVIALGFSGQWCIKNSRSHFSLLSLSNNRRLPRLLPPLPTRLLLAFFLLCRCLLPPLPTRLPRLLPHRRSSVGLYRHHHHRLQPSSPPVGLSAISRLVPSSPSPPSTVITITAFNRHHFQSASLPSVGLYLHHHHRLLPPVGFNLQSALTSSHHPSHITHLVSGSLKISCEYESFEVAEKAIASMDGGELLTQTVNVDWAFSRGPIRRKNNKRRYDSEIAQEALEGDFDLYASKTTEFIFIYMLVPILS